jgi:phenylalanyl-tRNA synthetase beta chain
MRVPLSWLREHVELPADLSSRELADRLTGVGLEVERVEEYGADISGPLVAGTVVDFAEEKHSNGKTIRWCSVDVGAGEPRGIVCGARNFAVGDAVVVALPGTTLPGGFAIGARKTYGHVSDGMICSARELGVGEEHSGILVLDSDAPAPGQDAVESLELRDDVLDIAVTPDRGYCLSVRGVAREASAALGVAFCDPAAGVAADSHKSGYPVRVEDLDGCPVFAAVSVEGFDASAPSPLWLRRRLELAGMRAISLAVDVTNYVMLELGQPLHGYDADTLSGPIVVRRAHRGEQLTTLDGTTRDLDGEDLLITDDSGPIGMAAVMGGAATELGPITSHVVVEGAHFDPVSTARTARRHRLPSEAAKRFERGVDQALPLVAARRAAQLLVRLGGGRVSGETLVGKAAEPAQVQLRVDAAGALLGMPVEQSAVEAALSAVGCAVSQHDEATLAVRPPTWRPDLQVPADLVEEVARLRGYHAIPSRLPVAPPGRGLTTEQRLRRRIGTGFAGAGFVEVPSYPFTGSADWARLGIAEDDPRRRTLRLANPLSEEEPELRTTLLPGLLRTAARNVARGQSDLSLFELGPVYLPDPSGHASPPALPTDHPPSAKQLHELAAALPRQPQHFAVLLCGDRSPPGWWGEARPARWADAIAAVHRLAVALRLRVSVRSGQLAPWHPGRCAEILLGDAVIGHAGELHPAVCQAFRLPARSCAAEVDLDVLLAAAPPVVPAPAIPTQPVAKEDVALVVGAEVAATEVEQALRDGAGPLLESLRLFDVYTGPQVGPARRSLAFALRFRASDRTLTEAEVRAATDDAVAEAARRLGAVPRR